jgi:hypothetical protein
MNMMAILPIRGKDVALEVSPADRIADVKPMVGEKLPPGKKTHAKTAGLETVLSHPSLGCRRTGST